LRAVLETFASIAFSSHGEHDVELAALLHRHAEKLDRAEGQVRRLIREVLTDGAAAGVVRSDVGTDELAEYCLHALAAAGRLASRSALVRLVDVTQDGLRPGAH
jgi:hypothetical protein